MAEKILTHLSSKGVKMVEVGDKPVVKRTALARGTIYLKEETIDLIKEEKIKKGNVLTTAQIAA
ncbi:MAG: cyclic pyranopterin monophosphate synthase MoaC, partial [Methanobacterium sp.]|nr:cyclic pyranopterin monophosphate synthase MoaC [Methanobacterium sp.]